MKEALGQPAESAPAPTPPEPEQRPAPRTRGRRARWVSAVADRVSAKWVGGAITAVVLASTAAFGGLEAVAEPPIATVEPGEPFTGAGLEMTPRRVVLIDTLPEAGVVVNDGERVLVLVMTVTNLDDLARASTADGGLVEIRIDGVPDVAPSVARIDDSTGSPWLQPDVPADVVLAWAVPSGAFAAGDEVVVNLHTATEYTGTYFVDGDYWSDVEVAAHSTIPIEDVGAGAE